MSALSRRHSLCALVGGAWPLMARAEAVLRMPGPPVFAGKRPFFQGDLARLALRKGGRPEALQLLAMPTWPRQVRELRDGHVDFAPLPAHAEAYAEYGLRRVDFPIRRGLLGLRRLVCRRDRLAELEALPDLGALKALRLGYGAEWVDRPLLEGLSFRTLPTRSTDHLYAALLAGECDYLSRGVNELDQELAHYDPEGHQLSAPAQRLLWYPLDDCYFVPQRNPALHQALTQGLQRALQDGSYQRLFRQHYAAVIELLAKAKVWTVEGYPPPEGLPRASFDLLRHWPAA